MTIAILIVVSYLLGSIPSGIWIGKYFFGKDIRQFGSGNSGATNSFRVLGKKAGFTVTFLDMLKGIIPTLLAGWLAPEINPLLIGVFAILGHTYPIFAQFKGGKAVATSAGVVMAYHPLFLWSGLALFGIVLYVTSMVSAASLIACFTLSFASLFLGDVYLMAIAFALTAFITYRHRSNIARIFDGTESTVPFGLKLGIKKRPSSD